jgi:hypothetical protein
MPGLLDTDEGHAALAIARLPASAQVRVGDVLALGVDTPKLHLFDPTTSQRL